MIKAGWEARLLPPPAGNQHRSATAGSATTICTIFNLAKALPGVLMLSESILQSWLNVGKWRQTTRVKLAGVLNSG